MRLKQLESLSTSHIQSMLQSQSSMQPSQGAAKKSLDSGLTLTSLVDCFTLLVIYLLVAGSFGADALSVPKDMILPSAAHSEELANSGTVIRVQRGQYVLNEKIVSLEKLGDLLAQERRQNESMIIQADKRSDYALLNPVVLTGLRAGFSKIKFAVLDQKGNE